MTPGRAERRGRSNDPEEGAARAVVRVLGGSWELHDTGDKDGQYDVTIMSGEGRRIALEVTSFGGDLWKQTHARVKRAGEDGRFQGNTLSHQWLVVFRTGSGVRELEPRLEEVLKALEEAQQEHATARYEGDNKALVEAAETLKAMSVHSVSVFDPTPGDHESRILLAQSDSSIGGTGALPAALGGVLDKGDNQAKLAEAVCDERHLYVFIEDGNAGVVLEGQWPLPDCPPDPQSVLDVIWVYSPSVSAYLFRVRPGTADWGRFAMTTGEAA